MLNQVVSQTAEPRVERRELEKEEKDFFGPEIDPNG